MDTIIARDGATETIIAPDGTQIATYTHGTGMPLVQGTAAAKPDSWPAFPMLAERFRVKTMDRRGRGASGDGAAYDLKCECEDVAAVVDTVAKAAGEPVNLFGHSFGGLLALEAALLTDNVRKLVLYEPAVFPPKLTLFEDDYLDSLQELLDADNVEGVVVTHYASAGLTEDETEQLKATPTWQERLGTARTIPRELQAIQHNTFEARRFQELPIPTLLMGGSDSPDLFNASLDLVHAVLPDSRIGILQGQQHMAMFTAPALFVEEVQAFLCGA